MEKRKQMKKFIEYNGGLKMDEDKTLAEKIDEIRLAVTEKSEKKKKFKMPLGVRFLQGKTRRKNFVIVQTIKTNGAVNFNVMKIEDDTVKVGENIHDASSQHVLRYKKLPLIIIPEWNIKPVSPNETPIAQPFSSKENFEQASSEGTLTAAEKLILTKMKLEAVKGKMQLNWKIILVVLALGAGVLYLLDYLKVI